MKIFQRSKNGQQRKQAEKGSYFDEWMDNQTELPNSHEPPTPISLN